MDVSTKRTLLETALTLADELLALTDEELKLAPAYEITRMNTALVATYDICRREQCRSIILDTVNSAIDYADLGAQPAELVKLVCEKLTATIEDKEN